MSTPNPTRREITDALDAAMKPAVIVPSGCRHCGVPERVHFQRFTSAAGWHVWTVPTAEQTKARMIARREATPDHPTPEGDNPR